MFAEAHIPLAQSLLGQTLLGPSAQGLSSLMSAAIALGAVVVLLYALRRVGQVVSALVAAAAAVGSVVVLVIVFFALFAVALMMNVPVG